MSKYIKPTIMLSATGASNVAASSCSTSTEDAMEIKNILESMGYDINSGKAFGVAEGCTEPILFEDYCKFSSSIQIFFS